MEEKRLDREDDGDDNEDHHAEEHVKKKHTRKKNKQTNKQHLSSLLPLTINTKGVQGEDSATTQKRVKLEQDIDDVSVVGGVAASLVPFASSQPSYVYPQYGALPFVEAAPQY